MSLTVTLSILILMTSLFIQAPLEFSAFPTILLIATLLRLALNVATTRLILSQGAEGPTAAGHVIAGFAAFFFLVAFGVIPQLEFEFFPQESAPGFHVKVTMPPGTPIERTEAVVDVVQAQLPPVMGQDLQALTTRVGHQDRVVGLLSEGREA